MKETKDVGLEDVNILDFTEDEPVEDKAKTEKKAEEAKLESITSFPWKSVSHVVIGPNGVSLVPAGSEKKFSMHSATDRNLYPTPGQAPSMLEYDLNALVGSMNAVSAFENENKKLIEELARIMAELDKVTKELAAVKAPKEKKEGAPDMKPMPEEKDKPEGMAAPPKEEEIMPVEGPVDEKDKKKKEDEKPANCEKSKEELAKDELKNAATKEKVDEEKKDADHNGNLADAIRLMQVAKKKNLL